MPLFKRGTNGTVEKLRKLSRRVARRPGRVVFPPDSNVNAFEAMGFGGDLTFPEVADALYYIADMLEE
jgi:hypothetical protein